MQPPGFDALKMAFVGIARPPGDPGKLAGKCDDVLAGTAADLDHIAGLPGQKVLQYVKNGLMVAVKGRRVEPTVRLAAAAILAKFDDIVCQFEAPGPARFNLSGQKPQSAIEAAFADGLSL